MAGWDDLRIFHAVARSGSLTGASRRLGLAVPTVRRRLDDLERTLGARLFDRLSSGYELTEGGRAVADRAEAMAALVRSIEARASGEAGRVRGRVRITASDGIGALWLAPRLIDLNRRHPELVADLRLGIARSDVPRGEAEVALRLGDPRDPDLVGRRIGFAAFRLHAAPAYLACRGEPRVPADLARHRIVEAAGLLREVPQARSLRALAAGEAGGVDAPVLVDSIFAQHAAARSGLGIAALPCYMTQGDPVLRPVVPGFRVDVPVWLLTRRDLLDCARVRAVRDFVAEEARRSLPQAEARPAEAEPA